MRLTPSRTGRATDHRHVLRSRRHLRRLRTPRRPAARPRSLVESRLRVLLNTRAPGAVGGAHPDPTRASAREPKPAQADAVLLALSLQDPVLGAKTPGRGYVPRSRSGPEVVVFTMMQRVAIAGVAVVFSSVACGGDGGGRRRAQVALVALRRPALSLPPHRQCPRRHRCPSRSASSAQRSMRRPSLRSSGRSACGKAASPGPSPTAPRAPTTRASTLPWER